MLIVPAVCICMKLESKAMFVHLAWLCISLILLHHSKSERVSNSKRGGAIELQYPLVCGRLGRAGMYALASVHGILSDVLPMRDGCQE